MLTTIIAPFLVALALSLILVPICRLAAIRYGHVARPREDRWNRRPVAMFGGVGIALVVGSALLIDLLPGATGTHAFAAAGYLAILLGATGGFLVYNLHPASIFMGDSGSLLLGFSFAAVTLSSGRAAPGRSDVLSI